MVVFLRQRHFAIRLVRLVGACSPSVFNRNFNCDAAAAAWAIAALGQKSIRHYLGGRGCAAAFYLCRHGGVDGGRKQATSDN